MRSLTDLLSARTHTERCALRFAGREGSSSFPELIRKAARLANRLTRLAQPDCRVLLVGENSPELVEALLACWWAGLTPSCFAPPTRMGAALSFEMSLAQAVAAGDFDLGFTQPQYLERCRTAGLRLGWHPLPLEDCDGESAPRASSEVAYLQFSSGTTLQPKPTKLSHANILANLEAIASRLPGKREDHSCVSWLPLYHDMGLVGCLLGALYAPGSLTLMTPAQFALRPSRWLDEIAATRATITAAPNFALEQLLQRDSGAGRDLSSLRLVLLGAETVNPATLRAFHAAYADQGLHWDCLTPVYGLAEATLGVTFSEGPKSGYFDIPAQLGERVRAGTRELLSLGRPLPGVGVQIRDEEGRPLEPDHLGEIYIDGPGVARALARPFPTGDVGFLHNGELYFVTRLKDVLVYHGRKHDPELVEMLVHPLYAAAVSGPEEQALCLTERPRGSVAAADVHDQIRSALARAPLPVTPVVVEPGWLPRTTSGKISRHRARLKYLEQDPRA